MFINSNNSNTENTFRDTNLVDYSRLHVEDLMLVEVSDIVLVLLPSYCSEDENLLSKNLSIDIPKHEIKISKQTYFALNATVLTNPSLLRVTNVMHVSDCMSGFVNYNYGCTLEYSLK